MARPSCKQSAKQFPSNRVKPVLGIEHGRPADQKSLGQAQALFHEGRLQYVLGTATCVGRGRIGTTLVSPYIASGADIT